MMSGRINAKSMIRWSLLLWVLPIAPVVLGVGIWAELSGRFIFLMVAIPVVAGLLLAVLGGRRMSAPDDVYGIISQGARSEGKLIVALPINKVPQVVENAARGKSHLSVISLSETGAELLRSANFKTWGERVTLQFQPITTEQTEIMARCEPRLGTTLIDYGQGAQDLRLLLRAIEEQASRTERSS